jgi:hypothetical protein
MDYKHKLHILKDNTTIFYNDGVQKVREVRRCLVETKHSSFEMLFDERFNEIDFIYSDNPDDPFKYSNHIGKYLKSKFELFKSSDFRFRIDSGIEGKQMKLEEFINFLKLENRETIINNILC